MDNNAHNAQHKPITQHNTILNAQNSSHNAQHNPNNTEHISPSAQYNSVRHTITLY